MKKVLTYIFSALLMFSAAISCTQKRQKSESPAQALVRQFPAVTVPSMVQDQQERLEYVALHYWDAFMSPQNGLRCDSLHIAGVHKDEIEQKMANYIYLLDMVPLKEARKSIARMADLSEAAETADTSSNIFESFRRLSDKYLYDPNSPLRNEDYYGAYAARLLASTLTDDPRKDQYAHIVKVCSTNASGTKAADFAFMDKNGRRHSLYGIKTAYTLLFFSNPGCESCLQIINTLREHKKVNEMIQDGSLAVVNVYIDEDIKAWREYMPIYPDKWYNGFDPDLKIRTENTYFVRAVPSLYLLDSQKTVLIKDAVPEKLFKLIESI